MKRRFVAFKNTTQFENRLALLATPLFQILVELIMETPTTEESSVKKEVSILEKIAVPKYWTILYHGSNLGRDE